MMMIRSREWGCSMLAGGGTPGVERENRSGSPTGAISEGCSTCSACTTRFLRVPLPLYLPAPLSYPLYRNEVEQGRTVEKVAILESNGRFSVPPLRWNSGGTGVAHDGLDAPLGLIHPANRGPVTHRPRASDNKSLPHPTTGIVSNPLIPDQPTRSESEPNAHNLRSERSARQHSPTSEHGYRMGARLRCANRSSLQTRPASRTHRPTRPDPIQLSDGLITKGGGGKKTIGRSDRHPSNSAPRSAIQNLKV